MTHYLHDINPIAFQFPAFDLFGRHFEPGIHWYGLMYLFGFGAGWLLGRARVRAGRLPNVNERDYGDLMFYAMLGVVLGGRIGYILFYDLQTYLQHPLQVFKVWEGGMSFHGGLCGVLVAAALWARRHRLHAFDTIDFLAPLVPAGLGFGRLGNFINGELWGKISDGPWAVIFPQALPPDIAKLGMPRLRDLAHNGTLDALARHPTQLYEAFLEGVVMFTVLYLYSRKPRPRYAVSGLFAVMYGCFRFIVEFVRVPDAQLGYLAFGWLTMGQVLSLPIIATGLILFWMSRRAPTLHPQPVVATPADA
jgi:phosphatidylglycerol:prolipoprotein diacylglycerol transferase